MPHMQILLAMLNECCLLLMFNLHQLFIHSLLFVESLFGGSCRGAEVLAYPDQRPVVLYPGWSSSSIRCSASGGTPMEW